MPFEAFAWCPWCPLCSISAATSVKRIAILGSTGSIGQSALAVVDAHADRLQVVGLAAGANAELLAAQIARYHPRVAAMATGTAVDRLQQNGSTDHAIVAGTRSDRPIAG